ncbi:MAG: tRNA threonylcarbamoyladenosine dehydratase [Flavobacteriales bacterium]|nr:tRNA threonylcarbamoyladenosine dehydratase [Flavobacteriales bacterium]
MDAKWTDRERLLIGDDGLKKLSDAHVLIVGMGGVGAFAAEFITRAGIGHLTIVDADTISLTNINRQLPATHSTIGASKVHTMASRLLDINPQLDLHVVEKFLLPENAFEIVNTEYSFVMDCIDSISPKLSLIYSATQKGVPLVSSMGAGGRLDPTAVRVADISKSHNCPLARNIRKRIKQETGKNARGFAAVYSEELADENSMEMVSGEQFKRSYYGTISYMPATFGLVAASYVIRELLKKE